MELKKERYINPFTDFGFKRLFGEEPNKDLLLDFLNEVLYGTQGKIVSLKYLKTEKFGISKHDRKAIFDLYCENEKGEKFIVEMQKNKQNFFKDRSVYYATFPIQDQAQRATWNYELKAVYTIGILDFIFNEDKDEPEKFRYDVKLKEMETNKTFFDKLTFIYFEMPKFNKSIDELESRYEKWLYVLKNLHELERLPEKLREKIFKKVFTVAEIAKFTREEYMSYEEDLKVYRDLKNVFDTAIDEATAIGMQRGMEKGMEKGSYQKAIETAKNLKKLGVETGIICESTGLSEEEVVRL